MSGQQEIPSASLLNGSKQQPVQLSVDPTGCKRSLLGVSRQELNADGRRSKRQRRLSCEDGSTATTCALGTEQGPEVDSPAAVAQGHQQNASLQHDEQHIQHWRQQEELLYPSTAQMWALQKDVTPQMRQVLIRWLIDVCRRFRLTRETLLLTINYMDRYLAARQVSRPHFQLLGMACLWVAGKYEEVRVPSSKQLLHMTNNLYTVQQLCKMENDLLAALNFELGTPTALKFLDWLVALDPAAVTLPSTATSMTTASAPCSTAAVNLAFALTTQSCLGAVAATAFASATASGVTAAPCVCMTLCGPEVCVQPCGRQGCAAPSGSMAVRHLAVQLLDVASLAMCFGPSAPSPSARTSPGASPAAAAAMQRCTAATSTASHRISPRLPSPGSSLDSLASPALAASCSLASPDSAVSSGTPLAAGPASAAASAALTPAPTPASMPAPSPCSQLPSTQQKVEHSAVGAPAATQQPASYVAAGCYLAAQSMLRKVSSSDMSAIAAKVGCKPSRLLTIAQELCSLAASIRL